MLSGFRDGVADRLERFLGAEIGDFQIAAIVESQRAKVAAEFDVVGAVAGQCRADGLRSEIAAAARHGPEREGRSQNGKRPDGLGGLLAGQPLAGAGPVGIDGAHAHLVGSMGIRMPRSCATSTAFAYPASAWRRTPRPGSVVRTRSRRREQSGVPSATTTMPACCA